MQHIPSFPPSLHPTSPGANLKGTVFDNSQMNGVNLRLASLKGASLRSCNLRYAVMAGTDLEVCVIRCTCTVVRNGTLEIAPDPLYKDQMYLPCQIKGRHTSIISTSIVEFIHCGKYMYTCSGSTHTYKLPLTCYGNAENQHLGSINIFGVRFYTVL